jgi:hypothetical protein
MTEEEKAIARMVLGHFGAAGGYEPGGFTSLLLQAYGKADPSNRARLQAGFPVQARMMDACMNTENGVRDLQAGLGVTP